MGTLGKFRSAFTLVELLVVVAAVIILFLLLMPQLAANKDHGRRINCVDNLRQIGVSWRLVGADSYVTTNLPNRDELKALLPDAGFTYQYFGILSNELNTPMYLVCPTDQRIPHTNFIMPIGNKVPGRLLNNTTVSYFVGRDAQEAFPQMLLSGDRNIAATNYATDYGYSPAPNLAKGNFVAFGTNNPAAWWTSKMHNKQGNVLFADGHVEGLSSAKLREHLRVSGDTNQPSNAIFFP